MNEWFIGIERVRAKNKRIEVEERETAEELSRYEWILGYCIH